MAKPEEHLHKSSVPFRGIGKIVEVAPAAAVGGTESRDRYASHKGEVLRKGAFEIQI
jgi:hypothetical protein